MDLENLIFNHLIASEVFLNKNNLTDYFKITYLKLHFQMYTLPFYQNNENYFVYQTNDIKHIFVKNNAKPASEQSPDIDHFIFHNINHNQSIKSL